MSGLSLRNAQLQVLSKALAHFTHDVQNHLAIINESAGWMKDLMIYKNKQKSGKIGRFFKRGKQLSGLDPYLNELNTIETNINQTSIIVQRLNSFAHGLEENRSVFVAGKVLEQIQDVFIKLARDKGVRLELKLPGKTSMIETSPSGFQLAVFANVEQIIKTSEDGDHLILETGTGDDQFQVRLTSPCPGELKKDSGEQDLHWYIIENLGGQMQKLVVDEKCITIMAFAVADEKKKSN